MVISTVDFSIYIIFYSFIYMFILNREITFEKRFISDILIILFNIFIRSLLHDLLGAQELSSFVILPILYFYYDKSNGVNYSLINLLMVNDLILSFSNIITYVVTYTLFNILNDFFLLIYLITFILIILLIYQILIKINVFNVIKKSNSKIVSRALFIYIILISFFSYIKNFDFISYNLLISIFFIIMILQMSILLLFLNYLYAEKIEENKIKSYNREIAYLIKYIDKLETHKNKLAEVKHDFNNLLGILRSLIDEENYNKANEYINKLSQYIDIEIGDLRTTNISDIKNIEIVELKHLLMNKLFYMTENNINYHFECRDKVKIINMEIFDFIRLVGILIDNACEEILTLGNEDNHLNILIVNSNDYLEIFIENPTKNKIIDRIQEKGYSTKKNHTGLGLYIIQEINAKNPQLLVNYELKNNNFLAHVVLLNTLTE